MTTEAIQPDGNATQTPSTIAVGEQPAVTTPPSETVKTADQVLYNNDPKDPPKEEVVEKQVEAKEEKKEEKKDEQAAKFELSLPENSLLSKEVINEITEYAKAENLSPAQAQKLLERESNAISNYHQQITENAKAQTQTWFNEVKNDRELGGENFNQTAEYAKRAMDTFGNDKLKEIFNVTGGGNHPEIVRFCAKIGKMIANDKLIHGQNHIGGGVSAAEVLYGKSK